MSDDNLFFPDKFLDSFLLVGLAFGDFASPKLRVKSYRKSSIFCDNIFNVCVAGDITFES